MTATVVWTVIAYVLVAWALGLLAWLVYTLLFRRHRGV
jgi:hypothetical protein